MNYRDHILSLAKRFRIRLLETAKEDSQCYASRKNRAIITFFVKDYVTYVVALHEIGHLIGTPNNIPINEELRAWQIARKLAGKKWNRIAAGLMYDSFESHYLDYNPSRYSKKVKNVMTFFRKSSIKKVCPM